MLYTVAIGDIHGHSDKLARLLSEIENWIDGQNAQYVFVGDYVNKGPDPAGVISIVRNMERAGAVCLRGNHEHTMIHANDGLVGEQRFLLNGGYETRKLFGSDAEFRHAQEWMSTLPTSYEDELRYYVHAGIDPYKPLDAQDDLTKMSIRDSFLRFKGPFPKYVVHGHTPTTRFDFTKLTPDVRDNRCCVDTGASNGGPLSAAIFNMNDRPPIHTISAL
jgi:serine/threonine protein phosphatase 1